MDAVWGFVATIAPSVVVGIFMALWNRAQKRHTDETDRKEVARLKAEELEISLLVATAQLSYAVAAAIKRGTPNGEIETGVIQYEKAMAKFREFEREQLARNITNL